MRSPAARTGHNTLGAEIGHPNGKCSHGPPGEPRSAHPSLDKGALYYIMLALAWICLYSFVPLRSACEKSTPCVTAIVRSLPVSEAPTKVAPSRCDSCMTTFFICAPCRFAPCRKTPPIVASFRLAKLRSAWRRLTPSSLALRRSIPRRLAFHRFVQLPMSALGPRRLMVYEGGRVEEGFGASGGMGSGRAGLSGVGWEGELPDAAVRRWRWRWRGRRRGGRRGRRGR